MVQKPNWTGLMSETDFKQQMWQHRHFSSSLAVREEQKYRVVAREGLGHV